MVPVYGKDRSETSLMLNPNAREKSYNNIDLAESIITFTNKTHIVKLRAEI